MLDTGAGVNVELGGVFQPLGHQHVRERSDAVAAHFRDGAVGVAVIHKPHAFGSPAAHHAQQPVAADAGAAVTEERNLLRGYVELVVNVDEDNEVVFGGVRFKKFHASESNAAPTTSSPAASSHTVRGSRLNQERWRRTYRRVPVIVCSTASASVSSPSSSASTWA